MRQHLKNLVTHVGGKLIKTAGRYGTFSQHLHKLAESNPIFGDLADLCDTAQADLTELAGHCAEFAKILDSTRKAMGGFDDLDALMPTEVSAVHGDAPPASLRPVFRSGQREFSMLDKNDKASETIAKITQVD
jgi:hypothetical protein